MKSHWYGNNPFILLRKAIKASKAMRALYSSKASTAVAAGANVLTRGSGLFGALGRGDFLDSENFESIGPCIDLSPQIRYTAVSVGYGHSAAVTDTGELVIFGRPYDFDAILRLNNIRKVSSHVARWLTKTTAGMDPSSGIFPSPKVYIKGENIASASCSAGFTVALTKDGRLFAFGANRWGQCGKEPAHQEHLITDPIHIKTPASIVAIDTGLQNCVALDSEGEVYCWGKGNRGQLGFELSSLLLFNPARVPDLKNIVQVGAGFAHCAAIDDRGSLFVWGRGFSDVITDDSRFKVYADALRPRKINLPEGLKAVEVKCSLFQTVIRADNGSVWAMGVSEYDRNFIVDPICVLRPIPPGLNESLGPHDTPIDDSVFDVPADATGAILTKGYNRVSVIYRPGASPYNDRHPRKIDSYDVVLHNGESYYLPLDLGDRAAFTSKATKTNKEIVGYCEGPNHSILLIN